MDFYTNYANTSYIHMQANIVFFFIKLRLAIWRACVYIPLKVLCFALTSLKYGWKPLGYHELWINAGKISREAYHVAIIKKNALLFVCNAFSIFNSFILCWMLPMLQNWWNSVTIKLRKTTNDPCMLVLI